MFLLFRHHAADARKTMSANLLSIGLLFTIFGLAVLAAPDLLAYLIAVFFLFMGISLLITWWQLRK